MSTPLKCPNSEKLRGLKSFVCKCDKCNEEVEIFSDEFEKEHVCAKCKAEIDFAKCDMDI